jgi:hypothetical protein
MPDMFSTLTFLERASLLFELFCLLAGLFFLARWMLKGKKVRINVREGDVDIGSDEQKDVSKSDVVDIIVRTSDAITKTAFIKNKQILYDQMCYLEERLVLLQDAFLATFRSKLAEFIIKKKPTATLTITSSQEYQFFESLIRLLIEDIKRNCRGIFIRNNFSHFSEKEFEKYLDEKIEFLWIKSCNFLRDLYPSDKMPMTYEELEKEVLPDVQEPAQNDLRIVFIKAVQIYNSRHDEVARIEQDLRGYLRSFGITLDNNQGSQHSVPGNSDRDGANAR